MERDYTQILARIRETIWAMTPEGIQMIVDIVERRKANINLSAEDIVAMRETKARRDESSAKSSGAIGIIPIAGPIFPKANMMTEYSGATSVEQFGADLQAMADNALISHIVLNVDSPGGSADMLTETAEIIREVREKKPITAVANGTAASGAYWLASQADRFFVTPSGQVGSVGVYAVHEDRSQMAEKLGVKVSFISAGEHKVDGNPFEPLSDDARAHMQSRVDETYQMFTEDVAKGRGIDPEVVRSTYGGGLVFSAKKALDLGMVDGIATFDDVIGNLVATDKVRSSNGFAPAPASHVSDVWWTWGENASYDADKEHSEPGTGQGGEPTPRTPPEDGDKAIEGGWRRPSPPIVEELEQEGSVMNREQLLAMAAQLGLEVAADISDEDLSAAVLTSFDEVIQPLAEARDSAQTTRNFRTDYPEEYEAMQELRESNRESEASAFVDSIERFADTTTGFSANVATLLHEAHVRVASGIFTLNDFTELFAAIANDGVVSYAERGSARTPERQSVRAEGSPAEIRKQFADAVKERMTEDNLDWKSAQKLVATEQPELAEAYLAS